MPPDSSIYTSAAKRACVQTFGCGRIFYVSHHAIQLSYYTVSPGAFSTCACHGWLWACVFALTPIHMREISPSENKHLHAELAFTSSGICLGCAHPRVIITFSEMQAPMRCFYINAMQMETHTMWKRRRGSGLHASFLSHFPIATRAAVVVRECTSAAPKQWSLIGIAAQWFIIARCWN
jgi:hypothetical protein